MKVLISDKTSEKGLDILRKAGFEVDVKTGLSEDEIVKIIADYDAQIVRSETKVTDKIIDAGKKLKIVARAGVGVDNINLEAATKKGIIVVNSPEGNTIAAAEHSIAMLMAMVRNIPMAYASLKEKKWDRSKYTGVEVYNKVFGVVGLGKIGTRVAKYGVGLGMKVVCYDRFVTEEYAKNLGIELASLDEIFKKADFISLHIPRTAETVDLINKESIKKMKDGVRIVNCARGGIVNEQDLYDAVESGKVAGAAVDVYTKEPADPNNPVLQSNKIVFTPHLGASTEEAQVNVAIDVAEQIVDVLNGGQARSAVNIPALKPELLAPVAKFMPLAEKLGKLSSQLMGEAVAEIKIEYCGELSAHNVSPLSTALLKGFLEYMTADSVNFVNAPVIARERGVKITESKTEETKDYANLISVQVKAGKETKTVSGTYSETVGDLIVEINGLKVNADPSGYLLIVPNKDVPGVVGRVGTMLGKYNVNIAGMNVGRASVGGDAVMVLNVDNVMEKDALKELEKVEGIIGEARLVRF
ncbi:MAG: phosphoglycerate dehydrogenase [Candidatus Margulisiibacteriota bacterium]